MGNGYNTLEINNQVYKYPNSFYTLEYERFKDIQYVTGDSISMLSILTGVDMSLLDRVPEYQLVEVVKSLEFLNTPLPKKPSLKYNFKQYALPDSIHSLKIGNFVSCEILTKEGPENNAHKITAYLLDTPHLNTSVNVVDCLFCMNWYRKEIENITKEYSNIFKQSKKKKPTVEDEFNSKWGWYSIFIQISNDFNITFRQVEKLSTVEVLNYLSYKLDKSNLDEIKESEQRIKNKIK